MAPQSLPTRSARPVRLVRLGAAFDPVIAERFSLPQLAPECERLGLIDRQERLAGVAMFFDYRPEVGTIEIGVASWRVGAITPSAMAATFAYPFRQLGCKAVLARWREDNERVHRLARLIGFTPRYVPHLCGAEGGFMAALTPAAWRASRFYREMVAA